MKLEELQYEYKKVTIEKLERGALIETVLTQEDGLVLVNRLSKPKKLVVISVDKENQLIYGALLVNTEEYYHIEQQSGNKVIQAYWIKQATYANFLVKDSPIDCGVVFSLSVNKLLNGTYYGKLTDEDLTNVMQMLEISKTIATKVKKRYGIRRM